MAVTDDARPFMYELCAVLVHVCGSSAPGVCLAPLAVLACTWPGLLAVVVGVFARSQVLLLRRMPAVT